MTFKTRLTAYFTATASLVVAVLITIALVSLNISEQRFSEEAIRGKAVLWQQLVKVQFEQMSASTQSLTRARDLLKALRHSKVDELAEAVQPTFNRLSSSSVITGLQIADKSGSIVFSAPGDHRGATQKSLVGKAIAEKKVFQGLELDDDGSLVAEVVVPLYYRGKLIGAGVMLTSLDRALEQFKIADGSEAHLYGLDGSLVFSTNETQFELLQKNLGTPQKTQSKQAVGGSKLSVVNLPVEDVNGRPVAQLLSATDYSPSFTRQDRVYSTGLAAAFATILACCLLIYWVLGRAFKPMQKCLRVMDHISSGVLTDEISVDSKDEFGKLMHGLKDMQGKLKGMIDDIDHATRQIDTSAGSLEASTQESNQRVASNQQIAKKLVDDVNQLSEASRNVAEGADDSARRTTEAEAEVENGRAVIVRGVDAIRNISEQVNQAETAVQDVNLEVERIGALLDVIKGIAEQTNLLALNAAIEAARAGEQGRGFAVVADEVRTLASKTQDSTFEIESMIESLQKGAGSAVDMMSTSITLVNRGVEIVNDADKSFNSIAEMVTAINERSMSISAASSQQMSLSRAMNDNIEKIEDATRRAAAGIGTTVESSTELSQLAEKLKQKVRQFRTQA